MAGRPPHLGGDVIGTGAERTNRCREKKCLSDRDHFGLKALLRGLVPEGREIWRRQHSSHNFDSRFLERRDLRPVIVAQRLETSCIDELVTRFLYSWRKAKFGIAQSISVFVIREKCTNHFVGFDRLPQRQKRRNQIFRPPKEMVCPSKTFVRCAVSSKEVGLPGSVIRNARDLICITDNARSEEHTSELQSRQYLVCRLLLEKKKKTMVYHAD